MLKATQLDLREVMILEYDSKTDNRGASFKQFSKRELASVGILTEFVEETLYCPAKKGTLYGIHFQNRPKPQSKLLYCTKGRCLDFAVDLRNNSGTYKQWVCVELSPENRKQIYIPVGFGHAMLTLEDDTHVVMKIDNYFDPSLSRTISYLDPDLDIKFNVQHPVLSVQDVAAPNLADCDINF